MLESSGSQEAGLTIRYAKPEDLLQCARLGELFYREGALPGNLVPSIFMGNWKTLIESGTGRILGAWRGAEFLGALGVLVYPDINDGEIVAQEAFWYVHPNHRGIGMKLLDQSIEDLRREGVKRMTMVHLESLMPDRLKSLYERLGFRPVESHYAGDL